MFFEGFSQTYHIPITIECALRGRLPLYSSVFVHTRSVSRATDQRPSAIHDRETRMLSAEASDSGLVSTARRRFSMNDTRVQRSLEPLNTAGPRGCAGADADVFDARVAGRGVVRIHGTAACSPQLGAQRTHRRDRIRTLPVHLRNLALRFAGTVLYRRDYQPLFDEPKRDGRYCRKSDSRSPRMGRTERTHVPGNDGCVAHILSEASCLGRRDGTRAGGDGLSEWPVAGSSNARRPCFAKGKEAVAKRSAM